MLDLEAYRVGRHLPSIYYIPEAIGREEEARLLREIRASKQAWKTVSGARGNTGTVGRSSASEVAAHWHCQQQKQLCPPRSPAQCSNRCTRSCCLAPGRRLQNLGGVVHQKGLIAAPLPSWLQPLLARLAGELGIFGEGGALPNHVLINAYEVWWVDGREGRGCICVQITAVGTHVHGWDVRAARCPIACSQTQVAMSVRAGGLGMGQRQWEPPRALPTCRAPHVARSLARASCLTKTAPSTIQRWPSSPWATLPSCALLANAAAAATRRRREAREQRQRRRRSSQVRLCS